MLGFIYLIGVSSFSYLLINFIEENRCFVREPGKSYDAYIGLEFTYSFVDKFLCYIHWAFLSWLVVFVITCFGIVMYLRGLDATPIKVIIFFIALDLTFVFLGSFIIAGDAHNSLVGG
jgi:hypothetical protein